MFIGTDGQKLEIKTIQLLSALLFARNENNGINEESEHIENEPKLKLIYLFQHACHQQQKLFYYKKWISFCFLTQKWVTK